MIDNYNKEEKIKVPEKKAESAKEWAGFGNEGLKKSPEAEVFEVDEKKVTDQMRKEIEVMEFDENLKEEAKKKALKIEFLGEKEKIEHLLKIARENGVVLAVKTAKETNDPYLLDILHDILSREGFYQKMGKTINDDNNKN